jgi:predicted nucleic acid-binding Zn ribbon protein
MAEVPQKRCEHCGKLHEVVGRVGDVPIIHCPEAGPDEAVMIVGDTSAKRSG